MKTRFWLQYARSVLLLGTCTVPLHLWADLNPAATTNEPPVEWIDPGTGHRVIRLSREPGSLSLYFNLNPFTPDGQKMIFTTPTGISAINLKTRQIEKVVEGRVHVIVAGHKTGQVYYTRSNTVYVTDFETKATRKIATLSAGESAFTVNSDETLLAGTITEQRNSTPESTKPKSNASAMEERFNQHLPVELFFLNLQTGEKTTFNHGTDWLNHLQFSPTDPNLLLFCHEGPWHEVDRIWTIHSDGTQLTRIHTRTMTMEIAGHEFWSADGKTVWYDLQTPRGEDFWLAGYNTHSGQRTWYHLQRDEWSVHFNVSPDGKIFCGDGGDEGMVAHAKDGKWIYLFLPQPVPDLTDDHQTNLITIGVLKSERLVNMSAHDYSLEPNAVFTPDGKWIVFRSNMHGPSHVYAVEVEKAQKN